MLQSVRKSVAAGGRPATTGQLMGPAAIFADGAESGSQGAPDRPGPPRGLGTLPHNQAQMRATASDTKNTSTISTSTASHLVRALPPGTPVSPFPTGQTISPGTQANLRRTVGQALGSGAHAQGSGSEHAQHGFTSAGVGTEGGGVGLGRIDEGDLTSAANNVQVVRASYAS